MITKNTKTVFLILALISGVAFLNSCKKNSASIVGTWTLTSERERMSVSGITTLDTTYQIGVSNQQILTLKSNSSFTVIGSGGTSAGVYGYTNNILTLVDTTGGGSSSTIYSVSTLTSNQLSLQATDTTATSPLTIQIINVNFSR